MQSINMTPEVAELVLGKLETILGNETGLDLIEVEIRAGDKSGRGGAPTDEVEIYARYEGVTLVGGDGND